MPRVARTAAPIVQSEVSPVRGGTETVLVAEDEIIVRNLDKRILERHGYTVLLANDGEEAVRLFEEKKDAIDLAFLDLVMPKLGGIEASLKMRQIKPSLKLLFASGYSVAALHSTFHGHEGLTILGKPYNPDDLLRKLREVLDK
jgi:CheY-like chemotaxis protein